MRTNSNGSSGPWAVATAGRRLVCSSIALGALLALYALYGLLITPTVLADDRPPADDVADVKKLLAPGEPGSWGKVLNEGVPQPDGAPNAIYNNVYWNALDNFYDTDATLLPTVKNGIWAKVGPNNPKIRDYFEDHFAKAAKKPKLQPLGPNDQHVVIMGNYASNQGLYTFKLMGLNPVQVVNARYTFVYKKVDPKVGWTVANTKIIQHHSSYFPEKCVYTPLGSDCPECECCLGVDHLLEVINHWDECGYYGTPEPR